MTTEGEQLARCAPDDWQGSLPLILSSEAMANASRYIMHMLLSGPQWHSTGETKQRRETETELLLSSDHFTLFV